MENLQVSLPMRSYRLLYFFSRFAGLSFLLVFFLNSVVAQRSGSINQKSFTYNIEKLLSNYVGVYTFPPSTVGSFDPAIKGYRVPDGPLVGNGDFAVAVGGNYSDQTFYFSKSDMSQSKRGVGGLTYSFNRTPGDTTKYRQEQDVYKSEVRSTIPLKGATVKMHSWISDSGNALITDIRTEEGVAVDITLNLWSHTSSASTQAGTSDGIIWSTREMTTALGAPPQPFSSKVAIATRVLGIKPTCTTEGKSSSTASFTLPAGKTIRIVTVAAGGYNATNHISDAQRMASAYTNKNIEAQYTSHLNWWKNYWAKSYIEISDTLLEKFYYGALYELACSSREGATAPGLTGAWHLNAGEVWGNRYTLNYNFEAPWWGVYSSNRPELAIPYYDVILKLIPAGKRLAADSGTKGVWFSVNAHAWGGFTDLRTLRQKGNAGMASLNFMMHYNYTQDEKFLVQKVWPLLKELDLFWEDNLTWDQSTSRYIIKNSGAREMQIDMNPNNDLSFVRAIYKFLINISSVLEGKQFEGAPIHITESQKAKWLNYVNNLSTYPTIAFNNKLVFKEAESRTKMNLGGPGDNTDVLTHVFPGEAISLSSSPELLRVAKNTVEALNSNPNKESWFQANSVSKIYEQAIRSGYPAEEVIDHLKQLLAGNQPYNDRGDHVQLRNNLTIVSPAHGWESVAAIEAINSMLLQSHDSIIRAFPVWIKGKDAYFKDLRAFGAFLVTSEYKNGQVKYLGIKSEAGRLCKVENPWVGKSIKIVFKEGKKNSMVSYKLADNIISFSSKVGSQYILSPK